MKPDKSLSPSLFTFVHIFPPFIAIRIRFYDGAEFSQQKLLFGFQKRLERLPSKRDSRFQTFYLFCSRFNLFNNLGSLLFAQS
jgi:hypothetical protein